MPPCHAAEFALRSTKLTFHSSSAIGRPADGRSRGAKGASISTWDEGGREGLWSEMYCIGGEPARESLRHLPNN
jgi:hypothetical protein